MARWVPSNLLEVIADTWDERSQLLITTHSLNPGRELMWETSPTALLKRYPKPEERSYMYTQKVLTFAS